MCHCIREIYKTVFMLRLFWRDPSVVFLGTVVAKFNLTKILPCLGVQKPWFLAVWLHWSLFSDLVILTTDVPTLFGVATGLAIFTALICFVLKLFSRARYSRPRHYANANLAPPILFSSETGECGIHISFVIVL